MNTHPKRGRSWIGFAVGLLAVVIPLGIYLLVRDGHQGRATGGDQGAREPAGPATTAPPSPAGPGGASSGTSGPAAAPGAQAPAQAAVPFEIDPRPLAVSGAAVRDPAAAIDRAAVTAALRRAEDWLRREPGRPYASPDLSSLRTFALEVECWQRLWEAEQDPSRQARIGQELIGRLRAFAIPGELERRLRPDPSLAGVYEVVLLTARCVDHGIDVSGILPLLRNLVPVVEDAVRRMPPPTAALFTAGFDHAGIDLSTPVSAYRRSGVLASRPREVVTSAGALVGLTQELWAYAEGGRVPVRDLTEDERAWLARALPHFALASSLIDLRELSGDLLSCLNLCGLRETHGYQEGIRILLGRQNPDGSFGEAGAAGAAQPDAARAALLVPTSTCIAALSLEVRARAAGS